MQTLRRFLEMIRFSHTLFALPFALFSAILAWYNKRSFAFLELVGIVLCMVFARSAAMAFNRLADRDIDAKNPRTAIRHLPSGQLSVGSVWLFTLVCCAGFVGSTATFLLEGNSWPIRLAAPVLLFVLAYSYTKRFTALAHFWLGASLLLAPLASWIAIRGFEDWPTPLVIGLAVLFWVAGFDIIYACQDADFDREAKLHSIPALLGVRAALWVACLSHVAMVAMLIVLYLFASDPYGPLGLAYLAALGGVTAMLGYEHALVRPDDLSRANQAFFNVNIIISVGMLAVLLVEVALHW
ncbi:MAG: 4-hydroxybenzoate octaprenyltransferase [Gemmataceae bacterium]|nr:4-hydroxybenzoate octaprenyltransferase [Gemmataceae bacterium]